MAQLRHFDYRKSPIEIRVFIHQLNFSHEKVQVSKHAKTNDCLMINFASFSVFCNCCNLEMDSIYDFNNSGLYSTFNS